MKKSLFCILFLLLGTSSYGQSDEEYWNIWNTNYPKVDIILVLKNEHSYNRFLCNTLFIHEFYQELYVSN